MDVYSTDGTCGQNHGLRSCAGKWGSCCSVDGQCGNRDAYYGLLTCQEGDCDIWKQDEQPEGTPWTPYGTCGGSAGYRCSPEWGRCCNVNGICGERPADCYLERACQPQFGVCGSNSTTPTSSIEPSSSVEPTSSIIPSAVSSTTATASLSTSPGGPTFVPGGGNFELLGCYREPDGLRALAHLVADDNMTIEQCLTVAAGRNFAGVEYGRECWSGNGLAGVLTKVDDSNCQFLFPGNPLQYCGSGNHLVLYSSGPDPVPPFHPPTVGAFSFVGCMTEAAATGPDRTLSGATIARDIMTLQYCADYCGSHQFFGIEYGRECYCGNEINAGAVAAPATDCNMPCGGDPFALCGAGNRLSVYGKP